MKSVRLSNSMREQILNQMMTAYATNNPPPKTKADLSDEAANELWQHVYGKLDFSKVPDGFYRRSCTIRVQIESDFLEFSSREELYTESNRHYNPPAVKVFDKRPAFYTKYLKGMEKHEEYIKARELFESELRTILWSCNTTKELINIWAEAKVYLPQGVVNNPTRNLPALQTKELNKKLGIKTG